VQNPVFTSSAVFGEKADRAVTATDQRLRAEARGDARSGAASAPAYPSSTAYASSTPYPGGTAPAATPTTPAWATPRSAGMTFEDVVLRTASVFGVLLLVGVVGWHYGPQHPALIWVGVIGGLALGLVNAFKKSPSAPLVLAYGAFEGLALGAISAYYEAVWPGIVVQAVLATVATFTATLLLFRSGKVRVTPRFVRWLMVAVGGYVLFSLVNLVLTWTGVLDGWGLRSGPWGVLIGLVAVGLAAACLIMDFDSIARGVRAGAPKEFAWSAAFGLVVTLVWLYLELLRLLAILRR